MASYPASDVTEITVNEIKMNPRRQTAQFIDIDNIQEISEVCNKVNMFQGDIRLITYTF